MKHFLKIWIYVLLLKSVNYFALKVWIDKQFSIFLLKKREWKCVEEVIFIKLF